MIDILSIRTDDPAPIGDAVGIYSDRSGKAFAGWRTTNRGRAIRLRLRVERALCRAAIRRYSQ